MKDLILTAAICLFLTVYFMPKAQANELTPLQREAPLFGTFLIVTVLTTNPIAATLATAGLYVGMDSGLRPAKRNKRHTRSKR